MLWYLLKHLYLESMALQVGNFQQFYPKCVTIGTEATIAWVIMIQIVEAAVVEHCMDIGSYSALK